jgi:uncharacterized membrane protein
MKKVGFIYWVLPFLVMSIPAIYLAMEWKALPAMVPTHFGMDGLPDSYGAKSKILYTQIIVSVAGILMYFLLRNIHKIDPRKKFAPANAAIMAKLSVVVLLLMCVLNILVVYWSSAGKVAGINILFCSISLLFAYIGNLLHSVKPNYFAGFRLPWTLESEDNWRRTHQMASKIWFWGGLLLALISLALPLKIMLFVWVTGTLLMTLIPVIYSYKIYQQQNKTA